MPPLAFRIGRYSAAEGTEQLERQKRETARLCESHGYEDGGWFGLDNESGNVETRRRQGKSDQTPTVTWALAQVAEAKNRWPNRGVVVVAWKDARLWRDVSQKEAVRRALAEWPDVWVHTGDGLTRPRAAADTFRSTVVAAGNQFYADSVRELIVARHQERIANGKPASGWPGFGHRRACGCGPKQRCGIAEEHDRWVRDEREAPILLSAVNDILNGTPVAAVVRRFNEDGVPSRLGGAWQITNIKRTLMAPRLAGILVRSGEEVGTTDYIEPLIDEPTFRRLQGKLAKRTETRQRLGMQLLTGVLFCGKCGKQMNSNIKGSKKPTRLYACRYCGGVNINADAVERVLTRVLFDVLDNTNVSEFIESDATAAVLGVELHDLEQELQELVDAAAEIPTKLYIAKARALESRMVEARDRLRKSSTANEAAVWIVQSKRIRRGWKKLGTDAQRTIILDVLGRFDVAPGGSGHAATDERVLGRLSRRAG